MFPRYVVVLALLLTAFLFILMPATMLWDWDEPLYARTGIEMFQSGDLMLPRFNGETFPHKPPLGYWLMGLSAFIFGETEFGVRFFSGPAIGLSALLVYSIASDMFGAYVAKKSVIVFATGLMTLYLGAAAMMDAVLLLGMLLSTWAVVKILYNPALGASRLLNLLGVFCVGMLVTMLVKGPVGPVLLGAMVTVIWLTLPSNSRPSFKVYWGLVLAGLVALGLFMLWFIPANILSEGELVSEGVMVHIVGRALAPMEGHGGQGVFGYLLFLPVYVPVIFLLFMPWPVYLPGLLVGLKTRFIENRKEWTILSAWFLSTLVIFSIAATKLPHYIYPVAAPMSIALAAVIFSGSKRAAPNWVGLSLLVFFYVGLGGVIVWAGMTLAVKPYGFAVVSAGLFFIGFAVWVVGRRGVRNLAHELAVGSLLSVFALYWAVLPGLEPTIKISREIGQAINENVDANAVVHMVGYSEPSLIFYASRDVNHPIEETSLSAFANALKEGQEGYLVISSDERKSIEAAYGLVKFTEISSHSAYNFNKNGILEYVYLLKWSN